MTRAIGVLRPEPGNARTAARVEAAGYTALSLPLFAVHPVAWSAPEPARFDSLLVSSANAFRHGGESLAALRGMPVHAVGAATAAVARAAGFTVVAVGQAGVDALDPPGHVLRLVGQDHQARSGTDTTIVVYTAEPLTPDLAPLAGGVALVHSPRAGERLRALCQRRSNVRVAAISRAAADAAGVGWAALAVASQPSDDALLAAALPLAD